MAVSLDLLIGAPLRLYVAIRMEAKAWSVVVSACVPSWCSIRISKFRVEALEVMESVSNWCSEAMLEAAMECVSVTKCVFDGLDMFKVARAVVVRAVVL
jgi:hypothetical protein